MPLDRTQLAIVHVAKKQLRLDDDMYRDALEAAAGVRSARELDEGGFKRVMKYFESLGFRNPDARRRPDGGALPTPWQLTKLRELFTAIGWLDSDRQRGFCKRQCGKPWPQTRTDANKVIEGLKAMVRRAAANLGVTPAERTDP